MWIPPAYAQVNLKWTGSAVPLGAETTFGVTCPIGATPSDVQVPINQALQASEFTGSFSNQVMISSMLIKVGPNETGAMAEFATTYPGGLAQEPVPPNVSVLVKKATALGGRKAQGRYFLPGIPEGQVGGNGVLSTAVIAALQEAQDEFLSALTTFQSSMHLLHSAPNSPVPPYPVMRLLVQPTVATQRRRLRH